MKKLKALFFGLLSIIVAVFCFTEEIIDAFPQAEPLAEVKEEALSKMQDLKEAARQEGLSLLDEALEEKIAADKQAATSAQKQKSHSANTQTTTDPAKKTVPSADGQKVTSAQKQKVPQGKGNTRELDENRTGNNLNAEVTQYAGRFSPKVSKGTPNQILEYKGFTVSYNNKTLLPNWVAYELTKKEAQGELPRKDKFGQDPRAKGKQADFSDYKHSGWDRGHMAPAGDMKWSAKAMEESYYFTNICPQNRQLNGGDWKELEEQCRKWAVKYGKVDIVCGPIVQENKHGKLGANGVVIPDAFYKIVSYSTPKANVVKGYIFYNPPKRKSAIDTRPAKPRPLESYVRDIAEIEIATGIKFR